MPRAAVRSSNRGSESSGKAPWLVLLAATCLLAPGGCARCSPPGLQGQRDAGAAAHKAADRGTPLPDRSAVTLPSRMCASHILITYKGAYRAPDWINRSRVQAREVVRELYKEVMARPGLFEELARRHSEAPRAVEGGYLGNWHQGKMVREFEEAVARLAPHAISRPVETSFGFHIIRREELMPEVKVTGRHILIAYQGALRASPTVTRSKLEAQALADLLLLQIVRDPARFEQLMVQYSDGPRAKRGGTLGLWTTGQGARPPVLEREILDLPAGGYSGRVVETPFGFHIINRQSLKKPVLLAGSHILVAYKEALNARKEVTRTRTQAQELAQALSVKVKKNPRLFEELARKHSDDISGMTGGDLGIWPRGQMIPTFEKELEKLGVNQVSRVIESPFGFHIIRRNLVKGP